MSGDPTWPRDLRVMYHCGLSSTHYKSLSSQVWWSQALYKRRCFFSLSHDLTCWYGQGVTWHNRRVSLIISDYPTKYGDHRACGRGDIKLSVYHVISLDHVIRGSRDIWMSSLIVSQCPVTFTGHRSRGIGDIKLLIYNVISRTQVVRGSCEIMGEFPSS